MKKRKARRRPVVVESLVREVDKKSKKVSGFGYEMPPDFEDVLIYFTQKDQTALAQNFYEENTTCNWKTPTGFEIKNWKVAATEWIFNYQQSLKLLERKRANNL